MRNPPSPIQIGWGGGLLLVDSTLLWFNDVNANVKVAIANHLFTRHFVFEKAWVRYVTRSVHDHKNECFTGFMAGIRLDVDMYLIQNRFPLPLSTNPLDLNEYTRGIAA